MPVTFFILHLYLFGQCPITRETHFETREACNKAGDVEIMQARKEHPNGQAFRYCTKEGDE